MKVSRLKGQIGRKWSSFLDYGSVRQILFVKLIFIFSVVSSFLIVAVLKEKEEKPNPGESQKYLIENFRALNVFLHLDLDKWVLPDETKAEEIDNPLIRNILQLKKAETLFKEKKRKNIPALLSALDSKYSFINHRKNELLLRNLYAQRKYRDYIAYFDSNLTGSAIGVDLELKLLLINSLLKTGDKERAFNIFKELFETEKLRPFQRYISGKELRGFLGRLTYDDWYRKFFYLVADNDYREFLAEKKYIEAPTLTGLIYAEFYYRRRQYDRALRSLNRVTTTRLSNHKKKLIIKINLRQDDYEGARATSRSGTQNEQGKVEESSLKNKNSIHNIIERVDELKHDKEVYSRLLLDCAGILLMKGDTELSSQFFEKYIHSGVPQDPDYYKYLWVTAWIHYRNGEKDKAVQYFEKGSASPFAAYKIANSYWLNKLTGKGSKHIDAYPFSYYYAKVAGNKDHNNKRRSKNFLHFLKGKQSGRLTGILKDIKLLLKAGLFAECFGFIDWSTRDERLAPVDRNLLKIIKSVIYLKQQDFYHAFVSFRESFPNYSSIVLPGSMSGIYAPVRYKGLIDKYAGLRGLDNMLLMALIREETMFRADAMSPARANGLMQLLVGTAQQMARGEGIKIKRWDLYDPEINIRLGTKYFRYLLDKYDGREHLALAAYNAGDHRVDQWLKEFGHVETEEFIEMIPFSETRSYVKNIFRNRYYYKYYYE